MQHDRHFDDIWCSASMNIKSIDLTAKKIEVDENIFKNQRLNKNLCKRVLTKQQKIGISCTING